jgi:uncharacterized protein YjiS (DUF1127 family)
LSRTPAGAKLSDEENRDEGLAMSAMTHGRLTFLHPPATPNHAAGRVRSLGRRAASTFRLWRRRVRDRQALQQLSNRDMRDIGATPSDIDWELSQPFWREPRRR